MQRICTQGPSFEDLKQYHTVVKKGGIGKTIEEKIAFVRGESLDGGMYVQEPEWEALEEIPFMQLYKGVEERNWRSPFYDPNAKPWQILFFEDCGRLFRPSFNGYRAVIVEEGKEPVWCNLSNPGANTFEEDYIVPREADNMQQTFRDADLGYPNDYGYRQVAARFLCLLSPGVGPSCFTEWELHTRKRCRPPRWSSIINGVT